MQTAIAARDAFFWWLGCWALFSGLDAAVVFAVWKLYQRRKAGKSE